MKLQILVPQYQETDEVIKPLLDSLMIQQSVDLSDFGVIIVNDGSEVHLTDEFLKSYPYKIEYYLAPHRGVSATRNTCLDYASADYIMFCDADDMFYNACGLYLIFREMEKEFDTLTSKFIEDGRDSEKNIVYVNHENDGTFVHGKIHRRQFLIDNNIRWDPELKIHEDSFFNAQCSIYAKRKLYLNDSFYLWKYREDSVCRRDPQYLLKTFPCLLDSMNALIDKLLSSNTEDKAIYYTVFTTLNIFYTLQKPDWKKAENIKYVSALELKLYKFFSKFRELWNKCDPKVIADLSQQLRAAAIKEGMILEDITVSQWLIKLDNSYKNVS